MSSALSPTAPVATASARPTTRRTDIDRVKGLAILLVVFGHLVARQEPARVGWYEPLRIAVYLFHMPLFMYLSGYVTFLSGAARMPLARWPQLVRRRAVRLLLPFLAFGLIVLCGKLLAAHLVTVDNVPPNFLRGLWALVWDTNHSPATSVWYIAVLFVFCVATPPLLALDRSRTLLVAAAALLYILPLPPPLYLNRVGTFFLFFVAGGLAADAGPRWQRIVDSIWLPALALLAAVALPVSLGWIRFDWSEGGESFPYKWALLLAGLLSLPAMHGLVRQAVLGQSSVLLALGQYVFVIYLLNTLFIGATKAVLLKFVSWDGAHFLPFAAALMLAGTLGPILTKQWVLRRTPVLDRATD